MSTHGATMLFSQTARTAKFDPFCAVEKVQPHPIFRSIGLLASLSIDRHRSGLAQIFE
jgi:hypothetical protein